MTPFPARLVDPRAGRRPAPSRGPRPVQVCPGGCGHTVPAEVVACKKCWYRLPEHLRQILHTLCRRYTARPVAVTLAAEWFRQQRQVAS